MTTQKTKKTKTNKTQKTQKTQKRKRKKKMMLMMVVMEEGVVMAKNASSAGCVSTMTTLTIARTHRIDSAGNQARSIASTARCVCCTHATTSCRAAAMWTLTSGKSRRQAVSVAVFVARVRVGPADEASLPMASCGGVVAVSLVRRQRWRAVVGALCRRTLAADAAPRVRRAFLMRVDPLRHDEYRRRHECVICV
jgi:hypothetical protein